MDKASDIGAAVADAAGEDRVAVTKRVRRWAALGVLPPAAKAGERPKDPYVFPRAAKAVAAILNHLANAGLHDVKVLADVWNFMAAKGPGELSPQIDLAMTDVATGGRPWLVLSAWRTPREGGTAALQWKITARFFGNADPIVAPTNESVLLSDFVLDLSAICGPFVGADQEGAH